MDPQKNIEPPRMCMRSMRKGGDKIKFCQLAWTQGRAVGTLLLVPTLWKFQSSYKVNYVSYKPKDGIYNYKVVPTSCVGWLMFAHLISLIYLTPLHLLTYLIPSPVHIDHPPITTVDAGKILGRILDKLGITRIK